MKKVTATFNPETHKIVPIESTDEMIRHTSTAWHYSDVYRAMVQHAPEYPTEPAVTYCDASGYECPHHKDARNHGAYHLAAECGCDECEKSLSCGFQKPDHDDDCPCNGFTYEVGSGEDIPECECVGNTDELNVVDVNIDDETIALIARYAHDLDITINDAFRELIRLGAELDELPPINEATGHEWSDT